MRKSAFVLGLIGGVFGILAGVIIILAGGSLEAFGGEGSLTVGLGFATFALAVTGLVGASLLDSRPVLGGFLMLAASMAGFATAWVLWLLSGPLLLLAGVFAWLASDRAARLEAEAEDFTHRLH